MPIFDFECYECEHRWEVIEPSNAAEIRPCSKCGAPARRIISAGRTADNLVDAPWIKSVTDIVAKGEDASPMDKAFAKNPTRKNYNQWMQSRGLRPMELGEKPSRPDVPNMERINKEVMAKDRARNRLEVR